MSAGMTRTRPMAVRVALSAALLACAAGAAEAQLNAENFARLGFNFNAPGARSAALGGAFIPLADDATAAETNPAGLTVLLYPQVSFEFKGVEYTRTLAEDAGGAPGGSEFTNQEPIPSFVSASLPIGPVTLAAFRHELVNYSSDVASSGVDFGGGVFLLPSISKLEMDVYNYGGALAVEMGPLSIGASGGMSQLDMNVDFPRFSISSYEDAFIDNRLVVGAGSAELDHDGGEATGIFVNGGVMLRFGEFLSIGGVYKLRPQFDDLEWRVVDRRGEQLAASDALVPQGTFSFKIPDAMGGGIAIRPHELFTITADAVLNKYSQIAANDALVFTRSAGRQALSADDYVADDGLDIHAGAEAILFLGTIPLALRAGAAQIAASNTYYIGTDPIEQRLWGTEPDEASLQFSAGLGTVLFQRMQFDGAVVMGENRREAVGSIVFFF